MAPALFDASPADLTGNRQLAEVQPRHFNLAAHRFVDNSPYVKSRISQNKPELHPPRPHTPPTGGACVRPSSNHRQTAITVTDFVTRYGSSASGPPSEP
ncbi:hypothetical protein C6T61_03485 [Burkholderia multivorans]|nr:hypothetical protein C6T61_03485 [Burkholderia multivorans]